MKMTIKDYKKYYKNNEFYKDQFGDICDINAKKMRINFLSVCDVILQKKEAQKNNWSKEDLKIQTIKRAEKVSSKIDLIAKSFTDRKVNSKISKDVPFSAEEFEQGMVLNDENEEKIIIGSSTQKMTPFNTPIILHQLGHKKLQSEFLNEDYESSVKTLEGAKKRIFNNLDIQSILIKGKEWEKIINEDIQRFKKYIEEMTLEKLNNVDGSKVNADNLLIEEMAWIEAENFAKDFAKDIKLSNSKVKNNGEVLNYGDLFDNSNTQLFQHERVESLTYDYRNAYVYGVNELNSDWISNRKQNQAWSDLRKDTYLKPKTDQSIYLLNYHIDEGIQYLYDYSMDISTAKQLENYFEVANNRANLLESGKFSELEEVDKTLGEIVKDILENEKTKEHLNMWKADMVFTQNKEVVEELKDIDIESFEIVYGSIERNDNNYAIKNFIDERNDCYVRYNPEKHRENLNEFYNNIPKRAQEKTEQKQLDLNKMSVDEISKTVKEEWTKTFFKNEPFKLPNEIVDLVEDFEEFKFNEIQRAKQEVKNLSLEDSYEIKKAIKTYEKENDLNSKEEAKSFERER